jgi:hypothetical protein
MVIKVRDMDCLVDNQVKSLACKVVVIGKCPANGGKGLSAKGWVIPLDTNRPVKVKKN